MRLLCALLLSALLVGCPSQSSTTPSADSTSGHDDEDEHDDARADFLRAGLITPGEYLFEIAGDDGVAGRRRGELIGIGGNELVVRIDGPPRRISRQAAWPMLCLRVPLATGDGALRIALEVGAPVYVIASDATSARVGPVPDVGHGEIVDRADLSLEGCTADVGADAPGRVGTPRAGEEACVFADQDPTDQSDGLAIAAGAPLTVLEEDGAWARVRISRPGGSIEGWMDATLLSTADEEDTPPDWCACSLRPDACALPEREPSEVQSRAWLERSSDDLPMPSTEPFEAALRAAEPRILGCWDELPVDRRPTRTARVEVRLEVDGDGQVSRAAVVRSTHAPEALSRCVLERARRVRFPSPRTGVVLRRTYAFDPRRAGDELE
ncbi:MAG: AgmX/PglI C-terminal domain-containing protein [Myxococcota bacterium]|nr:AgmX/PglI C-terminal domain-containing protein [Myxococcota bacterium]